MNGIDSFIRAYKGDSSRIRFVWNGKHADDFEDANETFRDAVLARLLEQPELAPLSLIRAVFIAETQWADESWCVDEHLHTLANLMLTRGGVAVLDDFLMGRVTSFDTYCACNRINIDPPLVRQLLDEIAQRLNGETDPVTREILQDGERLFADYLARQSP